MPRMSGALRDCEGGVGSCGVLTACGACLGVAGFIDRKFIGLIDRGFEGLIFRYLTW